MRNRYNTKQLSWLQSTMRYFGYFWYGVWTYILALFIWDIDRLANTTVGKRIVHYFHPNYIDRPSALKISLAIPFFLYMLGYAFIIGIAPGFYYGINEALKRKPLLTLTDEELHLKIAILKQHQFTEKFKKLLVRRINEIPAVDLPYNKSTLGILQKISRIPLKDEVLEDAKKYLTEYNSLRFMEKLDKHEFSNFDKYYFTSLRHLNPVLTDRYYFTHHYHDGTPIHNAISTLFATIPHSKFDIQTSRLIVLAMLFAQGRRTVPDPNFFAKIDINILKIIATLSIEAADSIDTQNVFDHAFKARANLKSYQVS
jgi:hypothetical protein